MSEIGHKYLWKVPIQPSTKPKGDAVLDLWKDEDEMEISEVVWLFVTAALVVGLLVVLALAVASATS